MKKTTIHKYAMLMVALVVGMLQTSCNTDAPMPDDTPAIVFASFALDQEESVTRAAAPLARDFVVYGYKTVNDQSQKVFDGYAVKYKAGSANTSEDNTHGYYYVGGAQSIKYWDFAASEYRFWGATGGTFSDEGTVLTIEGLTLTTTEPTSLPLYSELYHRSPVSSDVVQLQFKHPYAKVRVLFYTNATLTDNTFDNIKITGITFGGGKGSITNNGSLKVTYPKSGKGPETIVTTPTGTCDNLTFDGELVLDHTHGTTSNNTVTAVPTGGTEWYYTLPVSDGSPARAFTLNATIDGEARTATVPANFMQWKPNFAYTYIFKISGGKYMEFYDVQIDPWKYGGSQDEEWKNW